MTPVPSVKATMFQHTANRIMALVDSGRLTRADLERRLRPGDLSYLGKQLAASSWVPVQTVERMTVILFELEGAGPREEYLRNEGRLNGERVHSLGVYKQFEATSERWGDRVGRILVTLAAVAFNFMHWSFEAGDEPTSFRIIADDARDYPETLRLENEGFIEYMVNVSWQGGDLIVRSDRVTRDRIVFTIGPKESSRSNSVPRPS